MKLLRPSSLAALTITALSVVIMCSLGFWQLERMTQKQQRLSSITQKQAKGSLSLIEALAQNDPRDLSVNFQGQVDTEHLMFLDNQVYQQKVGYNVFAPVSTNVGWLLVNFGWMPAADLTRQIPTLDKANVALNRFEGVVSLPSNNPLVDNYLDTNAGFPQVIQQALPEQVAPLLNRDLLPYVVVLTQPDHFFVRHYTPVVMSPEKHLGYAIQWFGLAIAAALIGGIAIIKKGRTHDA
ncbi:SURF1 family protein [Alteromonas sp. KUL49]|uniref:SURF1 family protein n=1 Tax=Alteromonas sp. KUL49 TaxID=2480798 RepID=UPI00102EECBF|nr:SURF1 family protein [Alteromonas sp. KUL49]TAP42155.1 SURF1 family protein [Alteromonas sp. KUL49]GEA09740.1 SURF1-like protein [Alteromonas sp. KUL49]